MTSIQFAEGCTFTRAEEGGITIAWNNGHAITAVRGAAVDYVEPKYHMAVTKANNELTYAPVADLARLITGGINSIMALVIVGMRKVCASLDGVQLNIAEVAVVTNATPNAAVPDADWTKVTANNAAFRALLDIGPTILGMNGLSLMLKGHNYIESDSMWSRLESAADIESLVTPLGILDYAGVLFHDALHPFSAEWKVALAADVSSPIVGHVNGVLLKRLPGVPAGTTILFVTLAAIQEIKLIRPQTTEALNQLEAVLGELRGQIRNAPLDWCAVFQRAHTAANLARVAKLEPLCAFVYGACTALFDRRMSIMKSASFKNNSARHTAMTTLGAEWGTALEETKMDAAAITRIFEAMAYGASEIAGEGDGDGDGAGAGGA